MWNKAVSKFLMFFFVISRKVENTIECITGSNLSVWCLTAIENIRK